MLKFWIWLNILYFIATCISMFIFLSSIFISNFLQSLNLGISINITATLSPCDFHLFPLDHLSWLLSILALYFSRNSDRPINGTLAALFRLVPLFPNNLIPTFSILILLIHLASAPILSTLCLYITPSSNISLINLLFICIFDLFWRSCAPIRGQFLDCYMFGIRQKSLFLFYIRLYLWLLRYFSSLSIDHAPTDFLLSAESFLFWSLFGWIQRCAFTLFGWGVGCGWIWLRRSSLFLGLYWYLNIEIVFHLFWHRGVLLLIKEIVAVVWRFLRYLDHLIFGWNQSRRWLRIP